MLTDVITSLGTSATYTVTRTAEGDFTHGIYAPGADSEIDIVAAIQPLTGEELRNLPEGEYEEGVNILWTTTLLHTRTKTHEPDYITIGTELWEVIKVEVWAGFGDTHYKTTIVWNSADNDIDGTGAMQNSNEQSFQFEVVLLGATHAVTIPIEMRDASYTVTASVSYSPTGDYLLTWGADASKLATGFTLTSGAALSVGTLVDIVVRDRDV